MAKFTSKVTADLVVEITEEGATAPFLVQPTWPDGTPFADKAEATEFGKTFAGALSNPSSEFLPGTNPSAPKLLRTDVEAEVAKDAEIRAARLAEETAVIEAAIAAGDAVPAGETVFAEETPAE